MSNQTLEPNLYHYHVTKEGVVINTKTGKLVKQSLTNAGYLQLQLYMSKDLKINMQVGRAVALAYLPNPEMLTDVDHIDNNKLNNHLSNLRWLSRADNLARGRGIKTQVKWDQKAQTTCRVS